MELVDDPYLFTDSADGSVPWKADTISQYYARMRARVELEHIELLDLRKFMERPTARRWAIASRR